MIEVLEVHVDIVEIPLILLGEDLP